MRDGVRARLVGVLAGVVVSGAALPAVAATAPCAGGRFLLPGAASLVPGGVVPEIEAVVLEASTVTIASGCPPVAVQLKAGRRGTRFRALWPKGVCAGPPRKIRLTARIDAACTTLRGNLRGKRLKRRFAAALSACGDGILDRAGHERCPQLEGPDDGPALEAIIDLDAPTSIPDAANDVDAGGRPLVRTRIEVVLAATATVAQVNAVITRLGARIVSMLDDVPSVVLDLPDPGSVAALDAIVAQVASDPAVRLVLKAYEPVPDELPGNYTVPLADPSSARLDHHLAVRAAAAWNARAAMTQPPTVAVLDYFGDGTPNDDFDLDTPSPGDFSAVGQGVNGEHGYHVLGIIAGRFGGPNTDRGQATGIFPGTTALRVSDIQDPNTDYLTEQNRVLERLKNGAPHGILNTSLGYPCGVSVADVINEARWWTEKVRDMGLESRVLHLTSAGNIDSDCLTETDAETNSQYAAAALLPLPVPNLSNVLVVENAVNGAAPTFAPSCLSTGSMFPGHLAGIGTSVFSFSDASSATRDLTGTSMATPQVAGLAAYLWSLVPAMSVQQVRQALLTTASAPVTSGGAGCSPIISAPVIDAYAAVLSLDEAVLPDPVHAPIRQAIFDVDDSGRFDEADLAVFLGALIDPNTGDLAEPSDPDFGRHDLNGDGFTGRVSRTARFDLDRVDSVQFGESGFGVVFQTIGGVDAPFDEAKANDLDILCYAAYSDLYEGAPAARDAALPLDRCVHAGTVVTFPAQVAEGVPTALRIRVVGTGHDNAILGPLAGVRVELDPSGGTVAQIAGTTDEEGFFETSATAEAGATTLNVGIVARQAPGAPVLIEDLAQAAVTSGAVCTPITDALRLRIGVTGIDTDNKFGNVGATLTDAAELAGVGRVMAELSTGNAHVVAELDDGTAPATGQSFVGLGDVDDPVIIIPQDPTLLGTGGTLTARAQVDVTATASGDAFAFWRVSLPPTTARERTGRFTATGYEGDPLGDQDLTLRFTFGQEFAPEFSFIAAVGAGPDKSGAARIDATFRFLNFVEARDANGAPVGFSVSCTSYPTLPSTTSSTSMSTSTTVTTTSTPPPTTTTMIPTASRDPYRVYPATGPDGPQVTLIDRFRTETVDLGSVVFFLPPAGLDGAPLSGQFGAQTCYADPGAPFTGSVDVVHALGSQTLTLGNPVALCAPGQPSAVPVDHYVCYAASGSSLDQPHTLVDAFQTQPVQVLAPTLFCLPARVDGGDLVDPFTTLACYATDPPGTAVGPVEITNAFHTVTLDVAAPVGVCVPGLAITSP